MTEEEAKAATNPDKALYDAHRKVCAENSALRRRVSDLESFLRGASRQFGAMAGRDD